MANQFQIKRSSVPGKVPDAANVAVGELAVNLVDQRLYTKDGSGNIFLLGAGNTDRLIEGTANLFYTNSRVDSYVTPKLTTANVVELTNLYYTNARVRSTLTSGNGIAYNTTTGNITLSPTGVSASTYGSSSNVGVFTVDQFGRITSASNVAVAGVNGFSATGNSFTITTFAGSSFTANIQPDSVRLGIDTTGDYVKNVIAGTSIVITNQGGEDATPTISTSQGLNENSSPTFYNLTVSGNLSVIGNVTYITSNVFEVNDPLIYLAGNNYFSDVVDIGFVGNYYDGNLQRHAGLFRDASDGGKFKLFANLNPEPGDIIDTANATFRYADLVVNTLTGNLIGTVTSLSNHTTSNLAEGTNLYYTNARVYSNVIGLLDNKANVLDLTTANVAELTNLYYTNARVYSNVIGLINTKANVTDLTTANVVELTNLYYTNARVYSNVIGLINTKANVTDLTTSNVTEGTNLYYTNARVRSTITAANGINYNSNTGIITSGLSVQLVDTSNTATTTVANVSTLQFDSDSGFDVVDRANGIAKVQLNSTFKYWNVLGQANLVASGLDTVRFIPTNNIEITLNTNATPQSITFGANLIEYAKTVSLTTANVIETSGNLYFTNARARAALSGGTGITYNSSTGVISVDNSNSFLIGRLFAGEFIGNNATTNFGLNFNPQSANAVLVFVDSILQTPDVDYTLTAPNVIVFTSAPEANANIIYRHFSSTNIDLNLGNLGDVASYLTATANSILVYNGTLWEPRDVSFLANTTYIVEGTNLYYTNSRVRSAISVTGSGSYDQANGIITITGGVTSVNGANGTVTLTTTNIAEGSNLYYTNARIKSYLNDFDGNLVPSQNSIYNLGNITNRWKDLYLSGNTIDLGGTLLQSAQDGLTVLSANIVTLKGNSANIQYITVNDLTVNGTLTSNDITSSSITIAGDATVTGNLIVAGNTTTLNSQTLLVADNKFVLNSTHIGTPTLDAGIIVNRGSSSNVELIWNETTDRWQFTNNGTNYFNLAVNTTDVDEGTNLYYTNTRVYANISPLLTTANVSEVNNLYYTNSRVRSAISVTGSGSYDQANGIITVTGGVTSVNGANGAVVLSTANVSEVSNLYYTNARVYSNVISLLPNYTGNIGGNLVGIDSNTLIIAGSYVYSFLNTGEVQVPNVRANILYANIIQGATTSNIAEGSNLYYTNARVYSAITGNLVLKANVSDLTTSNVVEGANLYYTNARVDARIALANIRDLLDVSSNTPSLGQSLVWSGNIWHPETITGGGGGGGSNIILVGEQTSAFFYGDNTTTNFNLGFNPYNDNNIMVFVDGINQISPNNYTVSGQTLIFDEAPATNTVVAVRYFAANSVYNTKFFLGTATNQEFVGDGSNVNFQISGIAGDSNQTFVFVNGVIQQPSYNYSITNSTLAFTSAPDSGANIFVRTFSNSQNELELGQLKNVSNTAPATGQALTWTGNVWAPATLSSNVAAYQKYRYIATASQTVFTGADDSTQILVIPSTQRMQVHLNGVMLEPTLDYTANGSAVTLVLGAEAGDILSVGTFVDLGQGFAVDSFTGNGSTSNFTLSRVPNGGASLLVSLNGLKQHQTEFNITGTTLAFNEAPPANTAIEVTHMGNAPIATVIEQWAEISGNATAAPGYKYIVNTSAVPAFINMPPNPRLGDTVYFLDGTSSFNVNKLTLLRNGSKIMGLNEHFESDIEDSYFGFVYFNTTYGWRLLN